MKRSIKELLGYSVQAVDGEKGKVKNFLFDDDKWVVRYMEVDLGNLFYEKRVLIPNFYFKSPNWDDKNFPINLTTQNIENSPDLEFNLPVSRKYEKELMDHYELQPYWPATVAAYGGKERMFGPENPLHTPKKIVDEDQIKTNLRSFEEIEGYYIHAVDDRFGHIDDVIVDDQTWQIVYVIIDTVNIFPWSKKVMIPIEMIDEISFTRREAKIGLPKEAIQNAPVYDPAMAVNEELEKVTYDFYGRKVVK